MFAKLLHVVVLRLLQEIDGDIRVLQDLNGRNVVVRAPLIAAVVSAVTAQTRGQGRPGTANVDLVTGGRADPVDTSQEGFQGRGVLRVRVRGGRL